MDTMLSVPDADTFEDWSAVGRRMCAGYRQMQWLIGDWLISGTERYGERARDEAREIFRRDVERLYPVLETCRRFPVGTRHDALSFTHHRLVAGLDDHQEAERLLLKAEVDQLSTAALKAEVRVLTSRQVAFAEWSDDTIEDQEYRAIVQAWNRASTHDARRMFVEAVEDAGMEEIEL